MGGLELRRRKNKSLLFLLLFCIMTFLIIPFIISVSYGNIPFYNNNYLSSYDILVSNDKKLNSSDISFLNYNTYTWTELKTYIINNQMTFSHIFRDIVVLIFIAIFAISLDRMFGRHFPKLLRRK